MNAIILAAGMGTRLRPLTDKKPKPLVEVNGISLIESQLKKLTNAGIDDITIVTGYKAEQFSHLQDKYPVSFIFNDKYSIYNNWYSLFLAKENLGDTFIMDGDVFVNSDIFCVKPENSTYYCKLSNNFNNEWVIEYDNKHRVTSITIDSCTPDKNKRCFFSAVSYWKEKDSAIIKSSIEELHRHKENKTNLFWDNLVIDNLNRLDLHAKIVSDFDLYEVDSVSDLNKLESKLATRKTSPE